MTISSTARKAGPFSGTGSQTAFPFGFKVFAAGDLLVVQTDGMGLEHPLNLGTNYTVALNANQDTTPGGTVTLSAVLPVGQLLTIGSAIPLTQGTSIPNMGGFYPRVLEQALDKLTIAAQQTADATTRSLRFAFSGANPSGALPTSAARLGKFLAFDASGNPTAASGTGADAGLRTDLASPTGGAALVGFLQNGLGSVSRTLQDKARESVSVKDFGAKGDGVTNDSAAVSAALAAYDAVRFTPGTYILNEDILLNDNQKVVVEAGATLLCMGSRITAYKKNNVTMRVDGVISSIGMRAAPGLAGWPDDVDPGNPANITHERGFIEFGGINTAMSSGFVLYGSGTIHGDWTGTPSIANLWTGDLNYKGIATLFANNVTVQGVEVYGFRGEAVYFYTSVAAKNIWFDDLYVHDTNFNGVNFNCTAAVANALISNCVGDGAWQAYELSVGRLTECIGRNCESFPVQLGGGVVLDVTIDKCHLYGKDNQGLNVINAVGNPASPTGVVNLFDNYLYNAAQNGIYAAGLLVLHATGNNINGYAQNLTVSTQGFGINIEATVGTALTGRNTITSPESGFGASIRNQAPIALNSDNNSQSVIDNKLLKLAHISPQSASADLHEYSVFNGMASAPLRITKHYANGIPEALAGSDEFVRLHAEATPGSGGTNGRYVIATYKNVPAATPDDSLVIDSTGAVYPAVHNARDLGTNSNMWANLYCVAGVVNRSDARLKTPVAPMSDNEIAAATQLSREIGTYQWLDAVDAKGGTARHHVGMTVQRCIEVMQQNNLDPFAYAFICYDEWPETPHQAAGNAYGFRTDQLALFIQRGIDARLTKAGF